jgi:hypothetical protein
MRDVGVTYGSTKAQALALTSSLTGDNSKICSELRRRQFPGK